MDKLVYHYTSMGTLYKIIESQSFWLTSLGSSMDKNEMSYAKRLVKRKGEELLGQKEADYKYADCFYGLSCTEKDDSYFHFNNYADHCKGVSIGIDRNFIENKVPNQQCAEMVGYHLYFVELIYNQIKQNEEIEHFIKTHSYFNSEEDFLRSHILTDTFNYCLARIKRPEFESEQEVRLVYRQDYGGRKTLRYPVKGDEVFSLEEFLEECGLDQSKQCDKPRKVKFGCFGNQIRKYYQFSIESFGINKVIKSITVGPKSEQVIDELRQYLDKRNVDAEIKKSKIGLRN